MRTSRSSESTGSTASPEGLRFHWRALAPERRLAGGAAVALGASIFLSWWRDPIFGFSYSGVRRLTFVEVAIFLVAASVLVLLLRRAEGRQFHLPLADGTLVAAAGAWSAFLVVFRMLDAPTRTVGRTTTEYGLRWGIFVALAAAVTLAVAGVRMRRLRHRGERESVAADEDATTTLLLPR